MKSLSEMSLTEIRGIAQSYQINDVFQKEKNILIQEIELRQQNAVKPEVISVPKPPYDARLMTKPPARVSTIEDIQEALSEYIARGLHLSFPDPEIWFMQSGVREDTGTVRQPLRNIIDCARRLMVNGIVREQA